MVSKTDLSVVSYTLGVVSIVSAFFTPLAGLVFGIIGFIQSKKQKTDIAIKARKLNKIGIILSAILFAITIAITTYFAKDIFGNFPAV